MYSRVIQFYIYIYTCILFHYKFLQGIEHSSLCSTIGLCCLFFMCSMDLFCSSFFLSSFVLFSSDMTIFSICLYSFFFIVCIFIIEFWFAVTMRFLYSSLYIRDCFKVYTCFNSIYVIVLRSSSLSFKCI